MNARSLLMANQRFVWAVVVFLGMPAALRAWGPHSEITQAAMNTVPPEEAIVRRLGYDAANLRLYCWMPDLRRSLVREKTVWFYADDYLLFPDCPTHVNHGCPEVKRTYEPFFRRALQALRTETAPNAARWVGSLLHFVEDTGAPPHAAGITGDLHGKLENWLNAKQIHITGYRPQMLGNSGEEALAGFLRRMDGLIEYSKARAERAKPLALAGDRAAVEPILLDSALESSRVAADVLLTLGRLSERSPAGHDASLSGVIVSHPGIGIEPVPAKVVLMGTNYSTLADADGRYSFRGVPPGEYRLAAFRPGSVVGQWLVLLSRGQQVVENITLSPDGEPWTMLRNGAMRLCWVAPDRPDGWLPVKLKPVGTRWEGEVIPLRAGFRYGLQVAWREGAAGKVSVRLVGPPSVKKPPIELKPLTPDETQCEFLATAETVYAQVLVYGEGAAADVCRQIALGCVGAEVSE